MDCEQLGSLSACGKQDSPHGAGRSQPIYLHPVALLAGEIWPKR